MLYQHQEDGAAWLASRARGYLGDTPGLGKTRTLIAALEVHGVYRPLIVTPAIVRTHWRREFDEMGWFHREPKIKSYDEIVRGGTPMMVELLRSDDTDALILDEAHYLKHATSQRTRVLLGKDGYARRVKRVFLASGTPIPRNPAEIWTVLSSLFPEVALAHGLKTHADFIDRFCIMRGSMVRGAWREKVVGVKPDALPELREILGAFMLRRTLDDVGLDVPRIDWQLTRLDGAYDFDESDELLRNEERLETQLADIAADPHVARMRRRLGELKAPLVVEMLKTQLDADPSMRVAVFAHHRSVLENLREGLGAYGYSYIDGDTLAFVRPHEIERFQQGAARVFIGQNVACSTGMDGLQHATNRAVLVEPDWMPDVNVQLGHRVARIGAGYEGRAVVQMIALAGTLDEAIVAQNVRETRMVEASLGAKEAA